MHFWINKPAGRYYGFTGRRYPATPSPKTNFSRCRYNPNPRQMVTSLHRFQNLNTMENLAGPSNVNSCRVIRTALRSNNETQNNFSVDSTQRNQLNNNSNNVTTAGTNQLILSNTSASRTNRSLLDFSEFNDAELASYRLRCGVWITFVFATGFVAAAKFYFGDQGQGIAVFVFWGLLTLLLLFACLYSILCRRNQHNNHQQYHIQEEHIMPASATNTMSNENTRPISIIRQNPPPPYHIAILIPPHNSLDEAPPPSYDKIIR